MHISKNFEPFTIFNFLLSYRNTYTYILIFQRHKCTFNLASTSIRASVEFEEIYSYIYCILLASYLQTHMTSVSSLCSYAFTHSFYLTTLLLNLFLLANCIDPVFLKCISLFPLIEIYFYTHTCARTSGTYDPMRCFTSRSAVPNCLRTLRKAKTKT